MKGLKIIQLQNLLDFIYFGKVSIEKDNLEDFMITAEEFEIQGIKHNKGETPSTNLLDNVTVDQVANNSLTDPESMVEHG